MLHNRLLLASNVAEHTLSATFVEAKRLTIDKSWFDSPDSLIETVHDPERALTDAQTQWSMSNFESGDNLIGVGIDFPQSIVTVRCYPDSIHVSENSPRVGANGNPRNDLVRYGVNS